jgi:hypothetical protein
LQHQVVAVAVHDQRGQEIGLAVHDAVSVGILDNQLTVFGGTAHALAQKCAIHRHVSMGEQAHRDLGFVAVKSAPVESAAVVGQAAGDAQRTNTQVEALVANLDIGFIKQAEAASFTIPYNMYSKEGWKFDVRQMETALRKESITPAQK